MTERPGDRRVPYYRWEQFCAYENGDGTAHVLVIDDSGGRLFADGFDSIEEAQWTCGLLNAASGEVNLKLATWNLATWNRATGALRAGYADSSYSCKSCAATGSGTVNSSLATWGLGTWNTIPLN